MCSRRARRLSPCATHQRRGDGWVSGGHPLGKGPSAVAGRFLFLVTPWISGRSAPSAPPMESDDHPLAVMRNLGKQPFAGSVPGEERKTMETYQHEDGHDIRHSEASDSAKSAYATSDGQSGPGGTSVADAAQRPGLRAPTPRAMTDIPSLDAHEPQPPHTDAGPWPGPPQP